MSIKHLDEIIEEHEEADFTPRPRETEDEMDITPMIDIVFLLLIFFLVTSTPDETTAVELPNAQYGSAVSQLSCTIFTIGEGDRNSSPVYAADGKVEAYKLSDDSDELKKQIKDEVQKGVAESPSKMDVLIKADKNVKCREVKKVMSSCSKVENVKLHLAILTEN